MLPSGAVGEVVARGEAVFDGYENETTPTGAGFTDDWYRTGDLGYIDADGYLFLTGRSKELINRGGQKITPNEVDDALLEHPDVQVAATFPISHPTLGEEIVAAVVLKRGAVLSEETLSRFLRARLAPFKVPRRVLFVSEIPRGPTGKVQRHTLAAAFGLSGETKPPGVTQSVDNRSPTPLEAKLQALWAKSVGLEAVGLHDNFFMLGGDSLQAVDLFLKIENEIGRRLPRAILFETGTVAEMANHIEADAPSRCLVPIQPKGDRPPFFCVHDQNGHVLNFRDLARHVGTAQPFYGIQARGLDGEEVPFTQVDHMAAHYVSEIRKIQPVGPYFLGGYSFGGRVAYVMAQQLRATGEEVALLALFDTYYVAGNRHVSVRQWLARHRERMSRLSPSEIPAYLALRIRSLTAMLKVSLRSRLFALAWRYCESRSSPIPRFLRQPAAANDIIRRNIHLQPYDGSAVLFRAELPALMHPDVHDGWRKLIKGGLEFRPVPGRHFDFLKEPHVRTLAAELSDCLSEKQERRAAGARNLDIFP
jgi:thioesterase domain-containing protein/acyl carrier protein